MPIPNTPARPLPRSSNTNSLTDTNAVYDQVKREYADRFRITVGPPAGSATTSPSWSRGADARRLNLKTISDAARIPNNGAPVSAGTHVARGWLGFVKAYWLQFRQQPLEMDLSFDLSSAGEEPGRHDRGNSTDGLIAALDLFQLADDKHYFPPYQAGNDGSARYNARVPAINEMRRG
jgi:glycine betaine/choline ABC-type transport system substrate-binding protein